MAKVQFGTTVEPETIEGDRSGFRRLRDWARAS